MLYDYNQRTTSQPLIYVGLARDTADRDWFLGGTRLCDSTGYSFQSGRISNCTGFYDYGVKIREYTTNVTLIVDRSIG